MKPIAIAGLGAASGVIAGGGLSLLLKPDSTAIGQIPSTTSPDNAWINWGQNLISRFGQKQGCTLFLQAFNAAKPSIDTSATRDFFKANGMSFPSTGIDGLIDLTSGVFSGIGSVFGDIFSIGKTATYVVLGVSAIAIIMVVHGVVKNPEIVGRAASMAI